MPKRKAGLQRRRVAVESRVYATADPLAVPSNRHQDTRIDAGYAWEVKVDRPIAYWRLNETTGTNLVDAIGGHDLTAAGSVTLGVPGALLNNDLGVIVSSASTGRLTIANAVAPTLPCTFEAWHKRDDSVQLGAGQYSDFFSSNSANKHFLLINRTSNVVAIYNSSQISFTYTEPLDGLWHHYVVVYRSAVAQDLYIDGVFNSTVNSGLDPSAQVVDRVGSWGTTYPIGYIDEVAIYNSAMSSARILAHYNAGKSTV